MSLARLSTRRGPVALVYMPNCRHARLSSTVSETAPIEPRVQKTPLARMPTKMLLRSLFVTSAMGASWLLRPSLAALELMSRSKTAILNPDRNPILNRIMRWVLYDQFAAGTNRKEVGRTLGELRAMGYQGVILCYAKEVVLEKSAGDATAAQGEKYTPAHYRMVDEWKTGTIQTLRMLHSSDFLAVKLTGAGPVAIDAMRARQPMPKAIQDAMDEICLETRKQGSRLWVDAEQQILQHGLDEWVIELMRKHNRDGNALVYNTIQGYLKGAPANVERHLALASQEGWAVGLKLCRGAYIEHEVRSAIHDTKEDTDRCYDSITDMLINQRMPEGHESLQFPVCALFLATHNAESAEKAIAAYRRRNLAGLPNIALECGQLQGMADELSCALLDSYDNAAQDASGKAPPSAGVFKYLTWGSVTECMGYLHRRAIENRGAVERTQHMAAALRQELRRRILG